MEIPDFLANPGAEIPPPPPVAQLQQMQQPQADYTGQPGGAEPGVVPQFNQPAAESAPPAYSFADTLAPLLTAERDAQVNPYEASQAPYSAPATAPEVPATPEPQTPVTDPYSLLPAEEREYLEWAKSGLGQRFYQEAQGLVQQYGGEEALLAALDAPRVDEDQIRQEVARRMAPVLSQTDEYGEPVYTWENPLVQNQAAIVEELVRSQTIARLTQEQAQARAAQQAQAQAIESALTLYPNAERSAVELAARNGLNPAQYAQQLHTAMTARIEQARQEALQRQHPARLAPAPIASRPSAAPTTALPPVPSSLNDPRAFDAYEQELLRAGRMAMGR